MRELFCITILSLLSACTQSFETQPPQWTRDNINVYRSPATDENVTYSIIDSGVKQMSEGPEQKIKPQPYKPLRYKR